MGPDEPLYQPNLARRCAQIKHLNKLRACPHDPRSLIFLVGLNSGWVEYCTDCDKVTDKDSNY